MSQDQEWNLRLGVLSALVKRAPGKPGRTALMKFAYFLQTVCNVPLGYRFELYTYGPYDSAVLSDISQASTQKLIKEESVLYPSGLGYAYSPREKKDGSTTEMEAQVARFDDKIDWVIGQFGRKNAAELELLSTIVFAEREMRRKREDRLKAELCLRVKQIKPHFDEKTIGEAADFLSSESVVSFTG